MSKAILKMMVATMACGLLAAACGEKGTSENPSQGTSQESPTTIEYDFIPVDQWLPGTMWVPSLNYSGSLNDAWTWIQFRQTYDESRLQDKNLEENCMDTIAFDNGTYSMFGKSDKRGEYSVVDSVVHLGIMTRAFQISSDSMIVYNWHDCSYTQEVQSWLFTKIR